ncbi:MAG: hypothetical protein LBC89_01135, partial [Bacteroidales bacterium]|nr:hypothetical protein [Bacteroidales bacterium]
MKSKKIFLKITNKKIWFNDTDFIDTKQTDIPIGDLSFKCHREIFWKVQMKSFNKDSGKLFVDIINYDDNDFSTFLSQKPKQKIKYIEFGIFNWTGLEPVLSSYQIIKFADKLTNINDKFHENTISRVEGFETDREPVVTKFEEEFTINFNDSIFMLGYIKFSKHIKKLNQTLEFKIVNENILSEFDNIKYWFSKKLKTKKIRVKATFTLNGKQLVKFSATSKDIDNIDQNLIEGIKVQRTLEIMKPIRPQKNDKALFTSDDLLEGNVFKQTEKDILDMLIEKCNVRNKRELTYLSGSKQSLNYRIRFTNHPNFGFIFLAEGELNNHFIWELLNSHATYVWTIEKGKKEIELQYKRIEVTINIILDCGRENYKRAYRTTSQDNDLIFNVIHHKDKR